jgi:hypothetical protein
VPSSQEEGIEITHRPGEVGNNPPTFPGGRDDREEEESSKKHKLMLIPRRRSTPIGAPRSAFTPRRGD